MARDWMTTYSAAAESDTHTATFPQAAIAGHRLVAFAVAPASIDPPVAWTTLGEASDPLTGDTNAATLVAAGGETGIVWSREPAASTAPRALAGWVESRDDLGPVVAGATQVFVDPTAGANIELPPVVTTVAGSRIYLCIAQVLPDGSNPTWTPTFPSGLAMTVEDVFTVDVGSNEVLRLAVCTATPPAGSHSIVIGDTPAAASSIIVTAFEPAGGGTPPPAAENPIEEENRKPGTGKATWDIVGAGDPSIQGFATKMDVDLGTPLQVKVNSPSAWTGKVYRMGWYGGLGAREVATITGPATAQPNGTTDPATGMVSCANWSVSATWNVPTDICPGTYFIKIARNDNQAASHIGPFTVRDPAREAPILVKLSDSTWQAYNHAGADPALPFTGKNLYGEGTAAAFGFANNLRCKAVSYDRPFATRLHLPQTFVWNAEYPLIRWLERLGYDVDYASSVKVDEDPSLLLGRDAVISSGHDEYWSAGMRDGFIAARDHNSTPSHLLFMSGNEVFWRIRFAGDRRSYVCYKDSLDGALNPTGLYSGTWQDTRPFNNDRQPAALLTGTRFKLNGLNAFELVATAAHAGSPFWRSTPVAALTGVQTWTSPAGIVGFEADEPADVIPGETPAGLIRLSEASRNVVGSLSDVNGATYGESGTFVHSIVAYRNALTGAAVFGFGTCQYAWALDNEHDRPLAAESAPLQQALVNLLADLGQRPPAYGFPAGLVRSTSVDLATYGLPGPAPVDPDAEDVTPPCDWPVNTTAYADYPTFPLGIRQMAEEWAAEVLWALSGRRFGLCPTTVRPCRNCGEQSYQTYGVWWEGSGGGWVPYLLDGGWRNCGCSGVHTCAPASEVWLPGPVAEVVEVKVDGVVVPASAYRVDNRQFLVRQDGGRWPERQDLGRPAGDPDTFTVKYLRGDPVPFGGQLAAGALAYEFAKELLAGDCKLDARVTTITRSGVTMEVMPEESEGLTGVLIADRWLRAVNPHKLRQRPRVSSLDVPEPRIQTWG